jgi:hypothetical protein
MDELTIRAAARDPAARRPDPLSAASMLADLGFLASPDLPDRPGPAFLLVALREAPTLHHYDPEAVGYWVSEGGRGVRRALTRATPLPIETEFSWGLIRIVDRLHVTNEFLTFGGRLTADCVDGVVVAVFTSETPILRRGGHSQGWDEAAESLGAYFSRFLVAVDYAPGFEGRAARVEPTSRYAAFLVDTMARFRSSPALRAEHLHLWNLLQVEEHRLRAQHPVEWAVGEAFCREVTEGPNAIGQRPTLDTP